jgi:hypothetical protein
MQIATKACSDEQSSVGSARASAASSCTSEEEPELWKHEDGRGTWLQDMAECETWAAMAYLLQQVMLRMKKI